MQLPICPFVMTTTAPELASIQYLAFMLSDEISVFAMSSRLHVPVRYTSLDTHLLIHINSFTWLFNIRHYHWSYHDINFLMNLSIYWNYGEEILKEKLWLHSVLILVIQKAVWIMKEDFFLEERNRYLFQLNISSSLQMMFLFRLLYDNHDSLCFWYQRVLLWIGFCSLKSKFMSCCRCRSSTPVR